MRKSSNEKIWEPVEVLEIRTDHYIYAVQEELDDYNISVQIDHSQIESLFNFVLEVEMEESTEEEVTRGQVYVRKDRKGKYYSIKNIQLHLSDFLDFGFSISQGGTKSKFIVCIIFLIKLLEQLGAELEEDETAICVCLYNASKCYALTDDNIIKCIADELRKSDYLELNDRKIEGTILNLIDMRIVSVEEGRYQVTQTLVFE